MEKRGKFSFTLGKITFTSSPRALYSLILLFVLAIVGVGVYALTPGVAPNPGHLITEAAPPSPCTANQFLKFDGTTWVCADASGSSILVNAGPGSGAIDAGLNTYWGVRFFSKGAGSDPNLVHPAGGIYGENIGGGWGGQALILGAVNPTTDGWAGVPFSNQLVLRSNGNVGIGTTGPTNPLEICRDGVCLGIKPQSITSPGATYVVNPIDSYMYPPQIYGHGCTIPASDDTCNQNVADGGYVCPVNTAKTCKDIYFEPDTDYCYAYRDITCYDESITAQYPSTTNADVTFSSSGNDVIFRENVAVGGGAIKLFRISNGRCDGVGTIFTPAPSCLTIKCAVLPGDDLYYTCDGTCSSSGTAVWCPNIDTGLRIR